MLFIIDTLKINNVEVYHPCTITLITINSAEISQDNNTYNFLHIPRLTKI